MERINIKDLPELLREWFNQATTGKRKSNFIIYGYNSRFAVIRQQTSNYIGGVLDNEKKEFQWIVVEWTQQKNLNSFLFKKAGGLIKSDKAKILKDFTIDLNKERKKVN